MKITIMTTSKNVDEKLSLYIVFIIKPLITITTPNNKAIKLQIYTYNILNTGVVIFREKQK